MDLAEAKALLSSIETTLADVPMVALSTFDTPHGQLELYITERLRRQNRKGKVWKSHGMLATLKNAAYGFDAASSKSRGGADGIFKLNRDFRPPNLMIKKLFDRFLDKPDPLVAELEDALNTAQRDWTPIRLVSHHMRLLGVLTRNDTATRIVLVDYDDDKD
jgi:hypothetical protein